MKRIYFFLLYILQSICLWAQQPFIRNFTAIETNSGLQNWNISRTREGCMLFANTYGLLVYNSYDWQMLQVPNYTDMHAVWYDRSSNIAYVGAVNEFGFFYHDPLTNKIQYKSFYALLPSSLRDNLGEVWRIFPYKRHIVFQTRRSVIIYDGHRLRCFSTPSPMQSAAVVGGQLMAACKDGLYMLQGTSMLKLKGSEGLSKYTVRQLNNLNGLPLIATAENGFLIYQNHRLRRWTLPIDSYLTDNQIYCCTIKGDSLAVGTVKGGVVMVNLKNGMSEYVNTNHGLQDNSVLSVSFDDNGVLWLGLNNGIACVLFNSPYQPLLPPTMKLGTGFSSTVFGDNLFLGTSQGMYAMPLVSTINSPRGSIIQEVRGMIGQVWCVKNINGCLLCGNDFGAFRINGLQSERIIGPAGTFNFIPLKRHPGFVLACDINGFYLLRVSGGRCTFDHRVRGLNIVGAVFFEDHDGSIWIAEWQKGIFHVWLSDDLQRVTRMEHFHKGRGLAVDANNSLCVINNQIYISSPDGFYRYVKDRRTVVRDWSLNRIFNTFDNTLKVLQEPNGNIWAYKYHYLAVAQPIGNGRYKVDSTSFHNLAQRITVGLGGPSILKPGHIIFNVDNGFAITNYQKTRQKRHYQLFITRISSTDNDSTLYQALFNNQAPEIRIAHGNNSFCIEFALPKYEMQQSVAYSCYLEGYESKWGRWQQVNRKEYTEIGPGHYIFHVRARSATDGKEYTASFDITIAPAWYQSPWIWPCYLALLALIIWGGYRLVENRYQLKINRFKQEKEKELEKARLNIQLKLKTSELADSTINLARKNDMLQMLNSQMANLQHDIQSGQSVEHLKMTIRKIEKDIRKNMDDDDKWNKLEEDFNLIYNDFLIKLAEQYPLLKKNDLKLCAYIKMGLSSKDIASLTLSSVRSVETARYRLRKKLDLGSRENLQDFLDNFNLQGSPEEKD